MVSKLRAITAANVVELFTQIIVALQKTPNFPSELITWLHDPLRPCGWYAVFSAASDIEPLRSSTVFRITILNPSNPYSANNHWTSIDASSNTAIR
ncbi:hypothetical protein TNCV_4703751 [Trichonephila clavipes]|nr:hypothetical protein TNCV_4703751 [Trichonephila clavipes]